MAQILKVQMFGELSVSYGETTVDDTSNRMRKVWLLLAYLIYSRQKRNTQDQYIAVVQGADTSEVDDPTGRLKALFYRCRSMLNQLYDTAGHDLILRKGGSYGWNTEIPLQLDVEEFDSLRIAAAAAQDADEKLSLCRQALALYRGDFLPKLSMEPWVMPISTYYHQAFLDVTGQTLELLESRQGWEESATLCSKALHIEPYSEDLYQHLMRCRIAMGDREGAVKAYEEMSELLFDTFGVMPSEESRQLYRDASRQINDQSLPIGTVREQLRESDEARGAVLCEYDFFRFLYQVQARAIVRSGDVIHIALLSVHGKDGPAGTDAAETAPRRCNLPLQSLAAHRYASPSQLRKQLPCMPADHQGFFQTVPSYACGYPFLSTTSGAHGPQSRKISHFVHRPVNCAWTTQRVS